MFPSLKIKLSQYSNGKYPKMFSRFSTITISYNTALMIHACIGDDNDDADDCFILAWKFIITCNRILIYINILVRLIIIVVRILKIITIVIILIEIIDIIEIIVTMIIIVMNEYMIINEGKVLFTIIKKLILF